MSTTAPTRSSTGSTAPGLPKQTRTASSTIRPTGPAAWNHEPMAQTAASAISPSASPSRRCSISMSFRTPAPRPANLAAPPTPRDARRHTPETPRPTPRPRPSTAFAATPWPACFRARGRRAGARREPGRPDRVAARVLAEVRRAALVFAPAVRERAGVLRVPARGRAAVEVFPAMAPSLFPLVPSAPGATPRARQSPLRREE